MFKVFGFKGKYKWFGRDVFKKVRYLNMVVLDDFEIFIEIEIFYYLILILVFVEWKSCIYFFK